MHQTIHQRDHAGGVEEDIAPFGEGAVGGDQGGFLLIVLGDDLEQQVGVAVGIGEIPRLVDHQQLRPGTAG